MGITLTTLVGCYGIRGAHEYECLTQFQAYSKKIEKKKWLLEGITDLTKRFYKRLCGLNRKDQCPIVGSEMACTSAGAPFKSSIFLSKIADY